MRCWEDACFQTAAQAAATAHVKIEFVDPPRKFSRDDEIHFGRTVEQRDLGRWYMLQPPNSWSGTGGFDVFAAIKEGSGTEVFCGLVVDSKVINERDSR
jgi:hypothetical protein